MTSRVSFFKLVINDLKRRIWVPSVLLLLYILVGPVLLLIRAENGRLFCYGKEYIDYMVNGLKPEILTFVPTIIIASTILAISGFSFLFSKKKVDLFHSLPIKRERIFMVGYVSGLLVFAAVTLFKVLTITLIASLGGYLTSKAVGNIFITLLGEVFTFFFMYNVNILAVMLSGNIVISVLAAGVLNCFYPVFISTFQYLASYCYSTYYDGTPFYEKYPYLSPFMVMVVFFKNALENDRDVKNAVVMLLVSIVFAIGALIAGFYLYKKRPSECCQRAVAFEKSKAFIRVPLVILGGLTGIVTVSVNVNKYMSIWIWVGLVLGVLIVHCTIETIFNADFKAVFKDYRQMLACLAIVCAILVVYSQDLFGYDTYIPKEDNIASASVSITSLDSDLSCYTLKDVNDKKEVDIEYLGRNEYVQSHLFTDEQIKKIVYEFNKKGISFVDSMRESKENNNIDIRTDAAKEVIAGENEESGSIPVDQVEIREKTDDNVSDMYFTVFYKLKSGREIARNYHGNRNEIISLISELYNNETFKRTHYGVYDFYDKGVITGVEVVDTFSEKQMSVVGNEVQKFMKVYLDDLSKATIDDVKGLPIAAVSPKMRSQSGYNEVFSGYYIYPSFKNTIAYMESFNVNTKGMTVKPNADDVESISVCAYNYVYNKETDEPITIFQMMYLSENPEDRAKIDEFCKKTKIYNYGWSNSDFIDKEDRVELMLYYNIQGGIQKCATAYFPKNEIPEILKNDLIRYGAEHPYSEY